MTTPPAQTHESYIQEVRRIALDYAQFVRSHPELQIAGLPALTDEQLENIAHAKLVYGRGNRNLRGITHRGIWNNGRSVNGVADDLVEVCALGEESWEQLAGTTIHEMAHIATKGGHNKEWRTACVALGLRCAKAAGTQYLRAMFAPPVRDHICALALPTDGSPQKDPDTLAYFMRRGCTAGIGTRGGHTRGPGSGSRLRKYVCPHGQIVRASTDELEASCNVCGGAFARVLL